ncbi:MAG: SAF domain-containing protein [Actinobacteria bacterium]|nr:SAF domain-containing protein [Actinomycetota bacterium]
MAEGTSPLRARRNLRWMAVGVLAICLSGLGAALLYGNLSNAQTVITVKRTVYRDQVITAADLGVTSAVPASGVEVVPADRIDEVVGQAALYDLAEGSLLSPRAYGAPVVEVGSVRLGLRLAAGRLPSAPMPPGTEVLLVPVGRDGGEPPAGASIAGRIATSASVLPDGASIVDVSVASAEAERVARLAAADQLVVVRLPGGRR